MEMSEEEFIVNLPKFTNILETASNIGAKSCVLRMVHHTSNVHPTKKECIERCIKLLRIAETFSVRPSLEFMGNASCWNTLDSVLDIMKDIRHPLLALVLDTFHLFKSGDNNFTNFEKVALNPEQISVVHFTDARKDMPRDEQKDSDRRLPGLGQLNLKKFTTILNSLKFKGAYSLNVYDKSLWHRPPLEVAIEGFNKMANIISSPLE
jgi:sugar phosphate isomerase/epimerase